MHHAGLLLLVLVALLLLSPLMIQGVSVAGSALSQAGLWVDAALKLVDLSAFAGVLAVIIAGLLAVAILKLPLGF